MHPQKQPVPARYNLFAAALAVLMLVTGCASPTGAPPATNTPPSATATPVPPATPVPTATAEPTKFYLEFSRGEELAKLPAAADILRTLESCLECTSEFCHMQVFVKEGNVTIMLLQGSILDEKTNQEHSQPITLINLGEDFVPTKYDEILTRDPHGTHTVMLYESNPDEKITFAGIISHVDGMHYKLVQTTDLEGNNLYALVDDFGKEHPLITSENDPSMLDAKFEVPEAGMAIIKIPNPDYEDNGSTITEKEASARALNPLEQLKIKYSVDNVNLEVTHFLTSHEAWEITENQITDKQTGEIFEPGDYIIITPNGPVPVHADFEVDSIPNPGIGYEIQWKKNASGNLEVIAEFLGSTEEPLQKWNPENLAWEETEIEYATAREALMSEFEDEPIYERKNLSLYVSKDLEEETGYPASPLQEKDGIEPGAFGDSIYDVMKEEILANGGVAAIDLETGEIGVVEITSENFDEFNFVSLVKVDISGSPIVFLPNNTQEVEDLDLFIRMSYGMLLRRLGIFFDKKTNTIIVYIRSNPDMWYNYTDDDYRKTAISSNLTEAGALVAVKPAVIIDLFENNRGVDASIVERKLADKMLLKIRALGDPNEFMW